MEASNEQPENSEEPGLDRASDPVTTAISVQETKDGTITPAVVSVGHDYGPTVLTARTHHGTTNHHHHGADGQDGKKKPKSTFLERFREFCTRADMFATEHVLPIHILCIYFATAIIPISAVCIIWDLLSALVFEIPDLSTVNTPAFVLFINFLAIPLAMYGYMMEYLMHEHSKLAIVALICVIIHPIFFAIRASIEYVFAGYRGEEKIYFEGFDREGQEQKYPIGLVRYRLGYPYSDSEEGQERIRQTFGA